MKTLTFRYKNPNNDMKTLTVIYKKTEKLLKTPHNGSQPYKIRFERREIKPKQFKVLTKM